MRRLGLVAVLVPAVAACLANTPSFDGGGSDAAYNAICVAAGGQCVAVGSPCLSEVTVGGCGQSEAICCSQTVATSSDASTGDAGTGCDPTCEMRCEGDPTCVTGCGC